MGLRRTKRNENTIRRFWKLTQIFHSLACGEAYRVLSYPCFFYPWLFLRGGKSSYNQHPSHIVSSKQVLDLHSFFVYHNSCYALKCIIEIK